MLITTLSACSPGQVLGALTGGGPNVAANTQVGKTNTQTIGSNTINEQKIVRPQARTIVQDNSTTQQIPGWVWLAGGILFVIGWATDTPGTMIDNVRGKK